MVTASVSFIDALIAAGVSAACDQHEQPFILPEPGTLSFISNNGLAGKSGTQSSEYSALEHWRGAEQVTGPTASNAAQWTAPLETHPGSLTSSSSGNLKLECRSHLAHSPAVEVRDRRILAFLESVNLRGSENPKLLQGGKRRHTPRPL